MFFLLALFNQISFTTNQASALEAGMATPMRFFAPDPKKKTVCTMTVNSDDEKNVFLSSLGTESFNFVELIPQTNQSTEKELNENSHWFEDSCASNIQCDVLVISGHFAGTFFGSSGKKLDLQQLSAASCARSCDGILRHPAEVFLFGCNTLAGKKEDNRTPEQYRQVLLDDGFTPEQATMVANARYGIFSSDNQNVMARIFKTVPGVYGFSSIAPSGEHVKGFLGNYFKAVGNYTEHLNVISNQANSTQNIQLLTALKTTSVTQLMHTTESKTSDSYTQICKLMDQSIPIRERA